MNNEKACKECGDNVCSVITKQSEMETMSSTETSGFAHYAGAWLSYEMAVPELSSDI